MSNLTIVCPNDFTDIEYLSEKLAAYLTRLCVVNVTLVLGLGGLPLNKALLALPLKLSINKCKLNTFKNSTGIIAFWDGVDVNVKKVMERTAAAKQVVRVIRLDDEEYLAWKRKNARNVVLSQPHRFR